MGAFFVTVRARWHTLADRLRDERGSLVTEYSGIMAVGLIIVGMLGIALTAWAAKQLGMLH